MFDCRIVERPKPGDRATATIAAVAELIDNEVLAMASHTSRMDAYVITGKVGEWTGKVVRITKPPSRCIFSDNELARFKRRYGEWPEVEMKVGVAADESGYWTLIV